MKITIFFFGLILISANANAQTRVKPQQSAQPPDDNTPALKPGKVEGTVTSSLGGTPVKKATVTLRNLSQHFGYAAISDATGHFLVDNVQPGTYQVAADSSGFMASTGRASTIKPITVAEEQEVKDVAVKLTPLGS